MSVDQIDILEISGSDSIELSAGEVIETVTGSILVFALTEDGRRIPMATIPDGNVVVGCSPTQAGDRLLVTGMIGSQNDAGRRLHGKSIPRTTFEALWRNG